MTDKKKEVEYGAVTKNPRVHCGTLMVRMEHEKGRDLSPTNLKEIIIRGKNGDNGYQCHTLQQLTGVAISAGLQASVNKC